MKKVLLAICAIMSSAFGSIYALDLNFNGTKQRVISITPPASTGLDAVYVIDDTSAGITATYTSENAIKFYRFSNLGGAYSEQIFDITSSGNTYTLPIDTTDMGYIIEDGDRNYYFRIIDYAKHALNLVSLTPMPASDAYCDRLELAFDGIGDAIYYYDINGRREELSRDCTMEYTTLEYDNENLNYKQISHTETLAHLSSVISVPAPLCNTAFTLTGDRFLQEWNISQQLSTSGYTAIAIAAETTATQTERDADNEIKDNGGKELGGSAPCEITFTAAVSDAAIYKEWQISRTPEFEPIENSYNQDEFTTVFDEQGTTYVRFVANNDEGTCEYVGTTYEIFIGESKLDIPNAFSPEGSPGVNDIWKVSYKSLVSFECHIFNRWGTKMASFDDPAMGWDGKYNGKFVPAGVYYYVITAMGADGVKYKRKGDINIIKYNSNGTPESGDTE